MKPVGTLILAAMITTAFTAMSVSAAPLTTVEQPLVIGGAAVSSSSVIAQRTVGLFFEGTTSVNGKQEGYVALCSGSILDSSRILTAAHCVQNFQGGAVVFSADQMYPLLDQASKGGIASVTDKVRVIKTAVAQPGFPGMSNANNAAEFNDLAIITFDGGLPQGYEPAKFLDKATVLSALAVNKNVILAGYGLTVAPKPQPAASAATASDFSFESQSGKKKKPSPGSPGAGNPPSSGGAQGGFENDLPNTGVLRQVTVAYDSSSPKGIDLYFVGKTNHIACEGDSGGPASIQYQNETYVIGVDSRGDCSQNAIYTLIDQEIISQF